MAVLTCLRMPSWQRGGRGRGAVTTTSCRPPFDGFSSHGWRMAVSEDDRLSALDAAVREGFARRPGRDSPRAQCQDLTLSGSPLPVAHADVRLLTAEQVVSMGAPSPSAPPSAVRNSDTWVDSELPPRRGRNPATARAVTPAADTRGEEEPERSRSAPPNATRKQGSSVASSPSRESSPSRSGSLAADKRVEAWSGGSPSRTSAFVSSSPSSSRKRMKTYPPPTSSLTKCDTSWAEMRLRTAVLG
jgi:hypothetical protein